MIIRFAVFVLSSVLILCGNAVALAPQAERDAGGIVDDALQLAEEGEYRAALNELASVRPDDRHSYNVRFAKARILSWSGRYGEAEEVFSSLHTDYPDDPDILLAYGYLAYYQGDYRMAEERFSRVLVNYPDYDDARLGLERLKQPRVERKKRDAVLHGRIDTGTEISSFSRSNNEDWHHYFLNASIGKGGRSFSFRVEQYDRFSRQDTEYGAGYRQDFDGGWDAGLRVGYSPDASFRPENSIALDIGKTFEFDASPVAAMRLYASLRHDEYQETGIDNFTPGAEVYFANGVYAGGSLVSVVPEGEDRQYGAVLRVTAPLSDRVNVTVGGADAPEAIAAIVVRTRTVFANVEYGLNDSTALRAGFSRDDRENSYIRESFNVSLTKRF